MTQINLSMKRKQTHRHREQTCGCQARWERGGGGVWGQQMQTTEWIRNKIPLYSTGNYIKYSEINYNGKGYFYMYIYV